MKKRVLIVGVGSIGERQLRSFQRTGDVDVALCEVDAARRREVAERYGVREVFSELESALDASFDAAVVCTPAHLHVPMAAKLAERDCHLLIEKPLSTSLDGVGELARLVADKKLHVAVAYVWRAHPLLEDMRRAIRSGRFGRPLQLVVTSGQHFPTYRPAYRDTYYAHRHQGGGAIQDALTHLINAGEWLVGPARELVADAAHLRIEGVDVEDTVHVLTRHGDVVGVYTLNQHQAPNELTITVICAGGTCRFEAHESRWRSMAAAETPWREEKKESYERDDFFLRQARGFLAGMDGGSAPLCSLGEAEQTLRAILTVLRSAGERGGFLRVE